MSVLDVNYRYKVLSVNMEQATMIVEYDPLDDDCTPITLNCSFFMDFANYDDNDSSSSLDNVILNAAQAQAPLQQWKTQKYLSLKGSDVQSLLAANTYTTVS